MVPLLISLYPARARKEVYLNKHNSFHRHSSWPGDAMQRPRSGSLLVQVMVCHRLFWAKPLREPMTTYCVLDTREHISIKFYSKFNKIFIQQNALPFACKLAILFRPPCVKKIICTTMFNRNNDSYNNNNQIVCRGPWFWYPLNALPISTGLVKCIHMMTSSNGNTFRVTGLCAGNSPGTGEFPAQRSVTRSFDVFFDLYPNKQLSKQWWGWWFETPSCPLWRHRNEECVCVMARSW